MVYLDNAATMPLCDTAKQIIQQNLDTYGNPSSNYELGKTSKILIENAREKIASLIKANPSEIYFTSGGSEANTWATIYSNYSLSSNIEHHALKTFKRYSVDKYGIADLKSLKDNVGLQDIVSTMMVNNEIGTIQPIIKIAEIAHQYAAIFHTDAVQAMGHIPVNVNNLDVDMLSASGHKFGALKGIGFIYIRNNINVSPLIYGGKQERSMRGGTENILGILSMAAALEDSINHMEEDTQHIKKLRDKLLDALLSINGVYLNGSPNKRIYSNINVCINGVNAADFVTMCDIYGICISSGSACNEGSSVPSHVLKAIGLTDEQALSSVRITLGRQNTEEEIDYTIRVMTNLIQQLRTS